MIETVDELVDVLHRGAANDDGETVDLLAHGLQCADLLAASAPSDLELQVAGLVHDLGSVLDPGRPDTHASTGADAVRTLLGDRVANLVGRHDDAKRYLVTTEPTYRQLLSPQSIVTFEIQGGPMTEPEQARFAADADFDALITLRRADDAAKVPGREVRVLDDWRDALRDVSG